MALVGFLSLLYALSPAVLSMVLRQQLSTYGFIESQFEFDYPGWQGVNLHRISLQRPVGEQNLSFTIPRVQLEYDLPGLFSGRVQRIHIPELALLIEPMPASVSAEPIPAAFPLAPLISGQWLAQLPVNVLSIDQLSASWVQQKQAPLTLSLQGQIQDSRLAVSGQLQQGSAQAPIPFFLQADHSGAARLRIADDGSATPIFEWHVESTATSETAIELNGRCFGRLQRLVPMLGAWVTSMPWLRTAQGELQCAWQAQLPSVWSAATIDWHGNADLSIQNLQLQWREQTLRDNSVTARFTTDGQVVNIDATLTAMGKAATLTSRGSYQLKTGKARASLKLLPVQFSDKSNQLLRLLAARLAPLVLNAGRLSGEAQLQLQKKFKVTGTVQLDQISGTYNNIVFTGLTAAIPLEFDRGIRSNKPATLDLELLDVGFPLTAIQTQFRLTEGRQSDPPRIQVNQLTAHLLGGTASSDAFEYDLARAQTTAIIRLASLDLNKIMALEQQEGLSGSGVLDGEVPLEYNAGHISVRQGKLSAREPGGVIRYTPTARITALAETNQSVGMMVNALSNFQYQLLNVTADYAPSGDLELKVRLEGKNPDWQRGQPVNLNLNLQENIPALLRSLQLSDEIIERVRKHYQKSP